MMYTHKYITRDNSMIVLLVDSSQHKAGTKIGADHTLAPMPTFIQPYSESVKSDDERVADIREQVGIHIDITAQALGFDSIITAVTYAEEPADPVNQKKGLSLRAWRSECWAKCRSDLSDFQLGGDEPSAEDVISGLPVYNA